MGLNFTQIILLTIFCLQLSTFPVRCSVIQHSAHSGNCPQLTDNIREEIAAYQPTVDRIIHEIVHGQFAGNTWLGLSTFIQTFGPRLTGSQNLENSIDYLVDEMQSNGLENVHTEAAPITHWERGHESAELITPHAQRLEILGLGNSVGTPPGGIVANVLAVESFEEFDALDASQVFGKVVLFVPQWQGYQKTAKYRNYGARWAALKGAVAVLVRSITPQSAGRTLHTGGNFYGTGVKRIPSASVTVEDAMKLLTMYRSGQNVSVRLEMGGRPYPDPVQSRNTIAELHGTQQAVNESVVVVSGHVDSWDVGDGAMDNAGGAFVAWKAVEFLKRLGLRPKRTIRSVLWTGEELGWKGAKQYHADHEANEAHEFSFFMESDSGTFEPTGLGLTGNPDAACVLREILQLMRPLNATELRTPATVLSEVELWSDRGFPVAALDTHNEQYYWHHHSAGDRMSLEKPENLDKCAALFAAVAYVVADMSENMPRNLYVAL